MLSIIIVNFNTKKLLKKCLEYIISSSKSRPVEIIVVDNNSQDGSNNMVESEFSDVKLITNKQNPGFGRASNQGARIATGQYLLFLNSDALVSRDFLDSLPGAVRKLKKPGAVGFKILNADKSLQTYCGYFPTFKNQLLEILFLNRICKKRFKRPFCVLSEDFYQKEREVDWVSGSCFLVEKSIFQKVKGFDEKYFLYAEDVDLCYRIKKLGYKNIYLPIQAVLHLNLGSSSSKKPAIILPHQNMIYFFSKNYSPSQAFLLRLLFMFKSLIYSLGGLIVSLISKKHWEITRSYFFLLITLLAKKKFIQYENSLKR